MKELLELVYTPRRVWNHHARSAFSSALRERYPRVADLNDRKNEERRFQLRVNGDVTEKAIPYAALIAPEQELSGGYGGMSFVIFPADDDESPCLLGMVVGTNGLAPDEAVLGRPGHARKCAAIASWLNAREPRSAWAKRDPVRIDLDTPRVIAQRFTPWSNALAKYGKVLYAAFAPPKTRSPAHDELVLDALAAFIDLFFEERFIEPKKDFLQDFERIRRAWMRRVLPTTTPDDLHALLRARRYVIVEGPPGTGKTRLATTLLAERYKGRGRVIQFHAGTTYESFVGGLAPVAEGHLGFTFRPKPGHLIESAAEAANDPHNDHLLVIDEINRADLAKVLGEAIYLFEADSSDREIALTHDFDSCGHQLRLPPNLHVLGTMNNADRSIAMLDIAVRRRFAFTPLWPQLEVVETQPSDTLQRSFHDLLAIFLEHASDDALALMPGHAYFLGTEDEARARLATSVRPLLMEYVTQGYVSGFVDEVRAYLDAIAVEG